MPSATVESNAALYTTWDEEWRGRTEYRTELAPPPLRTQASSRLYDEYLRQRDAARAAEGDKSAAARLNADNVQHTEDVLEAAEAAIEQGVYDEAISVLSSAIDDGDETPVLYHLRGRAWLKLGQPKKALRDLDTCLLAEPWFPEAYVERGHCHQAMHDFPNAVAEFVKATKIMENPDASLFFEIGDCSAATQDNEAAAQFFAKAIELAPDYALAHWRLADVKAALGDEEGAIESYAMVSQTDTEVHLRYLQIAEDDAAEGKLVDACRTLDAVEKISPNDYRVFWHRAKCRMELEEPDWEGAYNDLCRCIDLDPGRETEAYIRRGRCAMRLENLAQAKEDAEYYMGLLEKQEQDALSPSRAAETSPQDQEAAFEGRLLRAHLYMMEAGSGTLSAAEAAKCVRRAVMDYDHVVTAYRPTVAQVRGSYPEAHYVIGKLLASEEGFAGCSAEVAKEACDAFGEAWKVGVRESLRHCPEVVVAEKRLRDVRLEAAKEEAGDEAVTGPASLRFLCTQKLTQKGKYGGRSMPGHFHVALTEILAKGELGEGELPPTQAEWARCARHMTLAWKAGYNLEKHAGLAALAVFMGRRKVDEEGNAVPLAPTECKTMATLGVDVVAKEADTFAGPWAEMLRANIA